MRSHVGLIKIFVSIILIISLSSINIYGASSLLFSDMKSTDWFYQDVATLVDKAIINGYTDGTFRPARTISVAEFIKMSLAATNQELVIPTGTAWYSKYTETAINQGYISPSYYKDYERDITRGEIGNIIDKILNLSFENKSSYIDNIVDYDSVASYHKESSVDVYIAGIITGYDDGTIKSNDLANRAEATVIIVRMIDEGRRNPPELEASGDLSDKELNPVATTSPVVVTSSTSSNLVCQSITKVISVDGIEIGMNEEYVLNHLGNPDERLPNQYGYEWLVYAGDYSEFKLIGIKDNKVVSFYSNVHIDSSIGLKIGSTDQEAKKALSLSEYDDYYYSIYDGMNIRLFSDKNVNDGIEGVLVCDSKVINLSNPTENSIYSMEKLLFHLSNGARKANGLNPVSWSVNARTSSYLHSEDMGVNEYFGHENLSGLHSKDRMQAAGVVANYYAENIAAGYDDSFEFHYALMHSEGHCKNILSERITHLGMGVYYNQESKYSYYLTENFYEKR